MGQVFGANCAACHAGGNNTVVPEKKLKKEALQQYGKYEISAIITQVTNGNGAMPAFGERLAPDDIEDVANYVRARPTKAGDRAFVTCVRRHRCVMATILNVQNGFRQAAKV